MKKIKHFTGILIALLLCTGSYAQQLPMTSTPDKPVWYYIQVKGSNNGREDLAFTEEGAEVHGSALRDGVTNPATVSAQLWRFEDAGDGYVSIVNKSTGQKINVAHNGSTGYASLETQAGKFKFVENTNVGYYSIQSAAPASGGPASEIYLHIANTNNFIVKLVGTDYGFGANSAFTFILYNDYNIEYSDETRAVWYNIVSGKTGTDNLAVKDNSRTGTAQYALSVEELQTSGNTQQWKIVKNAVSGEVNFINRATGNYIQAQSVADGAYNMAQPGAAAGDYTLSYLGLGQYTISGMEEDAVTRYLHLSSASETPQEYEAKNAKDSGFAWLFKKVSGETGINVPAENMVKITVMNGRIFVNIENYAVTTLSGLSVKKDAVLPTGIYLVTVNGKTSKVLVK